MPEISIEVQSRDSHSFMQIPKVNLQRGRGTDISADHSSMRHISFKEFQSLKSSQKSLQQRNGSSPNLERGAVTLVNFRDKLSPPSYMECSASTRPGFDQKV